MTALTHQPIAAKLNRRAARNRAASYWLLCVFAFIAAMLFWLLFAVYSEPMPKKVTPGIICIQWRGAEIAAMKKPEDLDMEFIVNGKLMSAEEIVARAKPAPSKKRTGERREVFIGWLVVGYPPDAIENARRTHKDRGELFDLDLWRHKNGPARIAKPFQIHEAALQCKRIAERDGWEFVEILRKTQNRIVTKEALP